MLIDEIRRRMKEAMKARNVVEKEILRVALGEITTEEARHSEALGDAAVEKILRKLVTSNRETLALVEQASERATLEQEIVVLESLLPKTLSVDEIVAQLAELRAQIEGAGNDGQATGVAMKHLKAQGAQVDGKDVAAAVKRIRTA
jgi:uncharacterized protein YqeY